MVEVTRLVLLDVRVLVPLVLLPMMVAVLLPVVPAVAVAVGVPVVILVKVELLVVEARLVVLCPAMESYGIPFSDGLMNDKSQPSFRVALPYG